MVSDQCEYGLVTRDVSGNLAPAKKPTRWATTSLQMVNRLSKRCSGTHKHQHLLGGRAADAAFYPLDLISEILRGIRDTYEAEHPEHDLPSREIRRAMARASMLHDQETSRLAALTEDNRKNNNTPKTTTLHYSNGTTKTINLDSYFKEIYRDEYTAEPLPRTWVESAIHEEIQYFNDRVWVAMPIEEALADPEAKLSSCRWVVCNKNDASDPDVRARLVAQEVGSHADMSYFAATPPLESKRMLLSQWATGRRRGNANLKLSFVDVKKAYFNGKPSRKIFIRPPPELGLPKNTVCKLQRCMYGTRDA